MGSLKKSRGGGTLGLSSTLARRGKECFRGLAHPCIATEEAAPSLTFLVKDGNDAAKSEGSKNMALDTIRAPIIPPGTDSWCPPLRKTQGWGSLKLWSSMEPKRQGVPAPNW